MLKSKNFKTISSRLICLMCLVCVPLGAYPYISTHHSIRVKLSPTNGGTVKHNGTEYKDGDEFDECSVTSGLNATAKPGYTFSKWTIEGKLQDGMFTESTNPNIEVAVGIERQATCTAFFDKKQPDISFDAATNSINGKWITGNSITVKGTVTNKDAASWVYINDDYHHVDFDGNGNWSYTIQVPDETKEQKYTFYVMHFDDRTMYRSVVFTVRKDVTKPTWNSYEVTGNTTIIDGKTYVMKGDNAKVRFSFNDALSGIAWYYVGDKKSSTNEVSLTTQEGLFENVDMSAMDYAGNVSEKKKYTYRVDGTAPTIKDVSVEAKSASDNKYLYKEGGAGKLWIKQDIETIVKANIEDPVSTNVCSGLKKVVMDKVAYIDGQFVLTTDTPAYQLNPEIVAIDKVGNRNNKAVGSIGIDGFAPNVYFTTPVTYDDKHEGQEYSGIKFVGYIFGTDTLAYNPQTGFDVKASGPFTFIAIDNVGNKVTHTLMASDDKHCVMNGDTVIFATPDENNELTIPEGPKVINPNLMKNNDDLEKLNLPKSIEEIKPCAFNPCNNLEEVNLNSPNTIIPDDALPDDPELQLNLGGGLKPTEEFKNERTLNWDLTKENPACLDGFEKLDNQGKLIITVDPQDKSGDEYTIATGDFTDVKGKDKFKLTGIPGLEDVEIVINGNNITYNGKGYKLYVDGTGSNARLVLLVCDTYTLVLKDGKAYKSTDNGFTLGGEVTVNGLSFSSTGWAMNNVSFHTSAPTVMIVNQSPFTCTVVGENFLSGGAASVICPISYGMDLKGVSKFKGNGSLTVVAGTAEGYSYGINALNSPVYFDELTLNVTGGATTNSSFGIFTGKNVIVTGSAKVTAEGTIGVHSVAEPEAGYQWDGKKLTHNITTGRIVNGDTPAPQVLLTKVYDTRIEIPGQTSSYLGDDDKDTTYTAGPNDGNGGAILVNEQAAFDGKNINFANNAATGDKDGNGGAIYAEENSMLNLMGVDYNNNSADHNGGAVYNKGNITMHHDTEFNGNKAGDDGGAIYNDVNGIVTIYGETNFNGNEAGKNGGAINNTGEMDFQFITSFTGNKAGENGGAINNTGSLRFEDNVTFTGNEANKGGAINNAQSGVIDLNGRTTFNGNKAKQGGGAIYNEGTINLNNTVTLATESDSIYNKGTMNWNLQDTPFGKLENFQYLKNDGGKLGLVVNPSDVIGSQYTIATGDFSDVKGKDVFTLKGIGGQPDVDIVINGGAFYNGKFYTLTVKGNELVLEVTEAPEIEDTIVDPSLSNKGLRKGEMVEVGGKIYYYGINIFGSTQEAIEGKLDDTKNILLDGTKDVITKNETLANDATLKLNDGSLTIQSGKKLDGGTLEISSSDDNSSSIIGEVGSKILLKDGATLGNGTNLYINDGDVQIEDSATFNDGAIVTKEGTFKVEKDKILNIEQATLKSNKGEIVNNGTMNLTEATLISPTEPIKNNGEMNVFAGTTTIKPKDLFINDSNGVLNLEKDAVLAMSDDKKVLANKGTINMKGGKIAEDVTIYNDKDLNWDVTERNASVLNWSKLNNNGYLGVIPGVNQPQDTTYLLASNVKDNYLETKFVFRGYKGKTDTLTIKKTAGGIETEVKPYGVRFYRVLVEDGQLFLRVLPGVCKIDDVFYNSLDEAIAAVKEGETIDLLTNIDMEHDIQIPAGTSIDLQGYTLSNPTGLDLEWDITTDKAPVVKDFDELAADGTLTLRLYDMQTRRDFIIANGAAKSTGAKFILTGAPTHDGKDRVVAVGGDSVFYGHRFFSLYINSNNEIVLRVTKVIPHKNEIWAISTDGSPMALANPQNFNLTLNQGDYVAADNITNFQFDGKITRIGMAAFMHNSKLKELYIPEGIELIAQDAVRDCQNLEYLSMLDSEAITIGPNAFEGCKKLSIIEWPEKLQTIDAFAFSYCDALDSLNLPASLKNIYGNAFSYNPNLKVVTLNTEDMEHIWKESFDKCNADLTIYVPYLSLYSYNQIAAAKGLNFQTVIPMTSDANGMIAFYSPNNFVVPTGTKVYNLKRTSATTTEPDVEFKAGEVVAGGQGYFVSAPGLTDTDFQFVTTAEPTLKQALSILTGTYKPNTTFAALKAQTGATELYKKDGDQTWNVPVTDDAEIVAPYTAILLKNGSDDIKLRFAENGDVTGIEAVNVYDNDNDNSYNTAGQKVSDSYRGIVIKNGKKYMNK